MDANQRALGYATLALIAMFAGCDHSSPSGSSQKFLGTWINQDASGRTLFTLGRDSHFNQTRLPPAVVRDPLKPLTQTPQIQSIDGKWHLDGDVLTVDAGSKGWPRKFTIVSVSDSSLQLREGPTLLAFQLNSRD